MKGGSLQYIVYIQNTQDEVDTLFAGACCIAACAKEKKKLARAILPSLEQMVPLWSNASAADKECRKGGKCQKKRSPRKPVSRQREKNLVKLKQRILLKHHNETVESKLSESESRKSSVE